MAPLCKLLNSSPLGRLSTYPLTVSVPTCFLLCGSGGSRVLKHKTYSDKKYPVKSNLQNSDPVGTAVHVSKRLRVVKSCDRTTGDHRITAKPPIFILNLR